MSGVSVSIGTSSVVSDSTVSVTNTATSSRLAVFI